MEARSSRPIRALVLSDDCNPEWPSLPIVAYKYLKALGDYAEVTVATQIRNRRNLDKHGFGKVRVEYIDNEYIAAPIAKFADVMRGKSNVGWTSTIAMLYPSYIAFEREVLKRFGPALRAGAYDVVHRATPMSPALPSPMATWSDVPFVTGPINGGLKWPAGFESERRREKEWLTYVRDGFRFLPFHRSTYDRSAAVLASFKHTLDDLHYAKSPLINMPEVGIDPELFAAPAPRPRRDQITFLFVGRLVPYKCADVVIEAFAQSPTLRKHRLQIVGDGMDRPALEAQIRGHGLESSVEMLGWKTQAEVGELMRKADVFAFPSVRELGAGVVVEALACGLPSIVVDYGGPGGLVHEGIGAKVPLGSKEELARGFAREMEKIAADPALREAQAREAAAYAIREFSWDAKARQTLRVYEWVLGRCATPADIRIPGETWQPHPVLKAG